MNRSAIGLVSFIVLALSTSARGADPAKPSAEAAVLTARIDAVLSAAWAANKIEPAEMSSDGEFLRRVYLDLAGRIPSVAEARAFLVDKGEDKRQRLVAQLLKRPTYTRHMSTVWRHLLLPEADTNNDLGFVAVGFEIWLREQFSKNAGYDQIVRELLTTPIDQRSAQSIYNPGLASQATPISFYFAKEGKPENLASASARNFLGLRLECAQCHDHPFATWTRDQFWGLAAFFAGIQSQDRGEGFNMPEREILDRREIGIPGTERIVQATYPDGGDPQWKFKVGPRQTLADWVTSKKNPYFAKATVNRVWAHMFGIGLVEPVDEMVGGQDTKIHHAELLNELAKEFADHKYDLKYLFEAIAGSKAYQLASRGSGPATLYSRQLLRGLTGEQLYDSLAVATGQPDTYGENPYSAFQGGNGYRDEFLSKFGKQAGKTTEHETSIIQALTLMNGRFTANATNTSRSELLSAVLEAPFFSDKSRLETIYLATLSRLPTEKELEKAQSFIARAIANKDTTSKDSTRSDTADKDTTGKKTAGKDTASKASNDPNKAHYEAVADVFWSLLNSTEFVFNH
jgi:hypothetical protein